MATFSQYRAEEAIEDGQRHLYEALSFMKTQTLDASESAQDTLQTPPSVRKRLVAFDGSGDVLNSSPLLAAQQAQIAKYYQTTRIASGGDKPEENFLSKLKLLIDENGEDSGRKYPNLTVDELRSSSVGARAQSTQRAQTPNSRGSSLLGSTSFYGSNSSANIADYSTVLYFERELRKTREEKERLAESLTRLQDSELSAKCLRGELVNLQEYLAQYYLRYYTKIDDLSRTLREKENVLSTLSQRAAYEDKYRTYLREKAQIEERANKLESSLRLIESYKCVAEEDVFRLSNKARELEVENQNLKASLSYLGEDTRYRLCKLYEVNQEETKMLREEVVFLREASKDIPTVADLTREKRYLDDRVKALEKYNRDLITYTYHLQQYTTDLADRLKQRDLYACEVEQENASLRTKLDGHAERIQELQQENRYLLQQYKKLMAAMHAADVGSQLEATRREWENRQRELESALERSRQEYDQLAQQYRDTAGKLVVRTRQTALLEEQIASLKDTLAEYQRNVDAANDKASHVVRANLYMSVELTYCKENAARAESALADARAKVVSLDSRVRTLQYEKSSAITRSEYLEYIVASLEARNQLSLEYIARIYQVEQLHKQQSEELAALQKKADLLGEYKQQLYKRLGELEESNSTLEVKVRVYESRALEEVEERKKQEAELKQSTSSGEKLESLKQQVEQYKESVYYLEQYKYSLTTKLGHYDQEVSKLSAQVAELRKQLRQTAEESRTHLERSLLVDARDQYLHELRTKLKSLYEKLVVEQERSAELDYACVRQAEALRTAKEQSMSAHDRAAGLYTNLQNRDKKILDLDATIDSYRQELNKLNLYIHLLQQQCAQHEEDAAALRRTTEEYRREISNLAEYLRQWKSKAETLQYQRLVDGLTLDERQQKLKDELDVLREEKSKLQTALTDSSSRLLLVVEEKNQVESRVKHLELEIKLLTSEVSKLRDANDSHIHRNKDLQVYLAALENTRAQMRDLSEENRRLYEHIASLEQEMHIEKLQMAAIEYKLLVTEQARQDAEYQTSAIDEQLKRKLEMISKENARLKHERNEMDQSVAALDERILLLQSEKAALVKQVEELRRRQQEMTSSVAQEKFQLSYHYEKHSQSSMSAIEELREQLSRTRQELLSVTEERQALVKDKTALVYKGVQMEEHTKQLELELNIKQEELQMLEKRMEELTGNVQKQRQTAVISEEEQRLQREIHQELVGQNKELQLRIESSRNEVQYLKAYLEHERDVYKEAVRSYEERLLALKSSELNLQKQVADLNLANEALSTSTEQAIRSSNDLQVVRTYLQEQNDYLRMDLQQSQQRGSDAFQRAQTALVEYEKISLELARVKARLDASDTENRSTSVRLYHLVEENEYLRTELQQVTVAQQDAEQYMFKSYTKLQSASISAETNRRELEKLKESHAHATENLDILQSEIRIVLYQVQVALQTEEKLESLSQLPAMIKNHLHDSREQQRLLKLYIAKLKARMHQRERSFEAIGRDARLDRTRLVESYKAALAKMQQNVKNARDLEAYVSDKMRYLRLFQERHIALVSDRIDSLAVQLGTVLLQVQPLRPTPEQHEIILELGAIYKQQKALQSQYDQQVALATKISEEQMRSAYDLGDIKGKILLCGEHTETSQLERYMLRRMLQLNTLKMEYISIIKEYCCEKTLQYNVSDLEQLALLVEQQEIAGPISDADTNPLLKKFHCAFRAFEFRLQHLEHGVATNIDKDMFQRIVELERKADRIFKKYSRAVPEEAEAGEEATITAPSHWDLARFDQYFVQLGEMLKNKKPIATVFDQIIAAETETKISQLQRQVAMVEESILSEQRQREELKVKQKALTQKIKNMESSLLECYAKSEELSSGLKHCEKMHADAVKKISTSVPVIRDTELNDIKKNLSRSTKAQQHVAYEIDSIYGALNSAAASIDALQRAAERGATDRGHRIGFVLDAIQTADRTLETDEQLFRSVGQNL